MGGQGSTTDRAALDAALTRVRIARETCLVSGAETADAEDLAAIYRAIAVAIPYPAVDFWSG